MAWAERAAHWLEVAEQVAQVERAMSEKAELTASHPYPPREADKAALAARAVRVALRVEKVVKVSAVARVKRAMAATAAMAM